MSGLCRGNGNERVGKPSWALFFYVEGYRGLQEGRERAREEERREEEKKRREERGENV